jgi:PAS domain S-box-containing protein
MGARIRALDWTRSSLGPRERWPRALRRALDEVLCSPQAIQLCWGDEPPLLCNDAYAKLIGGVRPLLLGAPARRSWPDAWPSLASIYASVCQGQAHHLNNQPLRLRRRGEVENTWFDIHCTPLCDDQGEVAGMLVTLKETTGQVRSAAQPTAAPAQPLRTHAARRLSEERLQLALEATELVGIWDWDLRENRIIADERFASLYGITAEYAAEGASLAELLVNVHPADRQRVEEALFQCIENRVTFAEEYRIIQRDGSLRWVFARGRCHYDEQGRPVRFPGSAIDISQQKRTEDALRESEELHRAAIELSPGLHWTSDEQGRLTNLPERWLQLAGLTQEQALGQGWLEWAHEDDRGLLLSAWQASTGTGQPFDVECRLRVANGSYHWMRLRALPLHDGAGRVIRWHGMTEDIHDRRMAEQAQRELNETLESRVQERTRALAEVYERLLSEMAKREQAQGALRQAQKMEAVGQLTGGIAHDFNNMLTSIIGGLDLIQRYIEAGRAKETRRFIDAALTSANRAAALTHRLLAFSRLQPLKPKRVDVNHLITSMEDLLKRTLGEQIRVEAALAADLWPVHSDENQLESALLNLVINARDAMPAGGTLRIETANVQLSENAIEGELPAGDYVALSVSDSGIGMSEDVLARAFEPFFTTKPIGQGTGLGLSMIYGFAKQSGGHIQLSSEPKRGSTARLYLPRHAEQVPAPSVLAGVGPAMQAQAGETVLLVEDEPGVRMLIFDLLDELGYAVLEAADGEQAIPFLESGWRIDLLVTDIGLPGINGRQLADLARRHRPDLKVLLISGYAEQAAARSDFLGTGMELLNKPFTIDALAARIRGMIGEPGEAENH